MENKLYSLEDIKRLEVIDINNGKKLGYVKDFKIDLNLYKIKSVIIPGKNAPLFGKYNIIEINWEFIKTIGEDVLIVDGFYDDSK